MYKCEIIADSKSPQGERITTYKVTYPRIVHAEMCRHRIHSRNSASSRAIPFKRMAEMVETNPFIPIAWQKDHKGMQGTEYFDEIGAETCKIDWLTARDFSVQEAKILNQSGRVTKQLCNRLLEPFMWHTELITGTEWDNFFNQRCPKYEIEFPIDNDRGADWDTYTYKSKKDLKKDFYSDEIDNYTELEWLSINKSQAEIHIQKIAEMMWDAMNESVPKQLKAGEWHIPYGDNINLDSFGTVHLSDELYGTTLRTWYAASGIELPEVKIATARCARISYETLGNNPKIDYKADIKLHDRLLESEHMSPFEHCARAMDEEEYNRYTKGYNFSTVYVNEEDNLTDGFGCDAKGWCDNFRGFVSYRHFIANY